MSSRREEVNKVKLAETNLKETANSHLIEPLNDILVGLHYQTASKIVECLENKELNFKDAYRCKKDAENAFLKK